MDYVSAINSGMVERYQNITNAVAKSTRGESGQIGSFENIFQSALNLLKETDSLSNMAQEEEINFAMGYTDNLHDLLTAQWKANMSLQYTVAVRNSVMDAYREIMNLQF